VARGDTPEPCHVCCTTAGICHLRDGQGSAVPAWGQGSRQSPPSCCQCHAVMKNSHGALVATVNYSVQLHDARQNGVSQHVLGHSPSPQSIPSQTGVGVGGWGKPPPCTAGHGRGCRWQPGHRLSPCSCHSCCGTA